MTGCHAPGQREENGAARGRRDDACQKKGGCLRSRGESTGTEATGTEAAGTETKEAEPTGREAGMQTAKG